MNRILPGVVQPGFPATPSATGGGNLQPPLCQPADALERAAVSDWPKAWRSGRSCSRIRHTKPSTVTSDQELSYKGQAGCQLVPPVVLRMAYRVGTHPEQADGLAQVQFAFFPAEAVEGFFPE